MERICVVGLGYVGLPVATELALQFPGTLGFDINARRVARLREGHDDTGEVAAERLAASGLQVTDDASEIVGSTVFIVTVPTPIDQDRRPDLRPLESACAVVGAALKRGGLVVFESTVYPGVTEEFCGPLLERASGLRAGADFQLGYSPERINPGDRNHTFTSITKVVAASDAESLARVTAIYGRVVKAGLYCAPSIKVAEAAKVLENTQRDINIALINELAVILDRIGVSTREVLAAAETKWNFLRFTPGLVGGHCIGVDPYYLTALAERLGYHPQVILAGRRINDSMGSFIAQKLVKLLIKADHTVAGSRVGILGLTFKEDVPDLRNSRVVDIIRELEEFGATCLVHDPHAEAEEARNEYGIALRNAADLTDLDAVVLAVPHTSYLTQEAGVLLHGLRPDGVLIDVKGRLTPDALASTVTYWSL